MKNIILVLALIGTLAQADMKECEYRIKMGDMTEQTAIKLYNKGKYADAREKFVIARSNLIIGFKHCLNTPREDELINKSAALSEIINSKDLKFKSNVQKLIRGAK